jgi:hypothetical protein
LERGRAHFYPPVAATASNQIKVNITKGRRGFDHRTVFYYALGVEMVRKPLYRCHIARADGSGTSGAILADLYFHERESLKLKPSGKQEIGTWRTSRHKTFRIHF